jgi:hypothetical protein
VKLLSGVPENIIRCSEGWQLLHIMCADFGPGRCARLDQGAMRGVQVVHPRPPGKLDGGPRFLHVGPVAMVSPRSRAPSVVMSSLSRRVPR